MNRSNRACKRIVDPGVRRLAALSLAVLFWGCATDRVLPPGAADAVQAFGRRLGPEWRLQGAELAQREARLVVCRVDDPSACTAVVLSDPKANCPGHRAGPWCATFEGGRRIDEVEQALAVGEEDPWILVDGGTRSPPWWAWVAGAGLGAVGVAGAWVGMRRRHRGSARWSPRQVARAVAGAAGLAAFTIGGSALLLEGGVRTWYRFSASRAEGVFDLYGAGGSTMAGEPYDPHVSPPLLVAAAFDGRILGREVRVHNLGRRGWSAYSQSVLLDRRLRHRDPTVPGAVLIYTGHNEGSIHDGADTPSPLMARLERHSLAFRELLRLRPDLRPPNTLRRFEWTLRRMVETARAAGLVPILATAASNEASIEPNVPRDAVTPETHRRLAAGQALEAAGRWSDAADAYLEGVAPDDAAWGLLAYRAAGCLRNTGEAAAATALFGRVVATDPRTGFGRTTPAQNAVIRRVAEDEGVPLVDVEEALRQSVPDRILDDRLFVDGHHPNLAGYRILAEGFAAALAAATRAPRTRAIGTDDDVCRLLACPPRDLLEPHMNAALWLLASSARHPAPRDRLALARGHVEEALARNPDDPGAWFTLAVIDAAQRGALLWEESDLQRLLAAGINFGGRPRPPAGEHAEWMARFEGIGVSPAILEGLRRSSAPEFEPKPKTGAGR